MSGRIGIAWPVATHGGWGLLGLNLATELHRTGAAQPVFLVPPPNLGQPLLNRLLRPVLEGSESWRVPEGSQAQTKELPYPVLHSLGPSLTRTPTGIPYVGSPDIGIVFLENSLLDKEAKERASTYRLIVAGCQWNGDLLRAARIEPVVVWQQGVDLSRFHPAPARRLFPNRFVIFSGGGLQLRKGQDLVVKAFKIFREKHDEALLITAWASPYTQYARTILLSKIGVSPFHPDDPNKVDIASWLLALGLPKNSFMALPLLNNPAFPDIYREADVGLFPNRAEGGTNLVAMEAMACGVPCILSSGTGHRDLIERFACYPLEFRPYPPNPAIRLGHEGWCESSVDEIVACLEKVYTSHAEARRVGLKAAADITDWSWERQTPRLLAHVQNALS